MALRDYVVQTTDPSAATTSIAVQDMTADGFTTTWLSTTETYTDRHRRTRTLKASLFPGYVIVAFDTANDYWMRIPSCRGVRRILGAGPLQPIPLPPGALDDLRRKFEAGEFNPKTELPFQEGERPILIAGPFAGKTAICQMARGERVEVLLNVFGQEVPLIVRADMLRRVAS